VPKSFSPSTKTATSVRVESVGVLSQTYSFCLLDPGDRNPAQGDPHPIGEKNGFCPFSILPKLTHSSAPLQLGTKNRKRGRTLPVLSDGAGTLVSVTPMRVGRYGNAILAGST
jgi:hypothetical protein